MLFHVKFPDSVKRIREFHYVYVCFFAAKMKPEFYSIIYYNVNYNISSYFPYAAAFALICSMIFLCP